MRKPPREKTTIETARSHEEFFLAPPGPVALGTGVIALNIVVTERPGNRFRAAGRAEPAAMCSPSGVPRMAGHPIADTWG